MTVISRLTAFRIPDAAEVESQCFTVPWSAASLRSELNSPFANYFYVTVDGVFAGYGGFLSLSGEGEITRIAVLPQFRRMGLGKQLMEAMLSRAGELGLSAMFLEVRESNSPAIGLYQSFGFSQVGRRPNYYTDPTEAAVLMSADLKK